MSTGFNPKSELPLNRELRVQELDVCGLDYQLYSPVTGTPIITSDPFLATAGNYAVLAATAVTNTGSSVLTGNLGLNPGTSVTGFPPGTISGSEDVDNTAAMNAQASALSAYIALNAMSATTIANVLDGQTLVPGNYKFSAGSVSLAGSGNATLTLNGAGNYVFQVPSTLVTGAGGIPTITLSGGATAAKIYWVVGSSATINVSGSGVFKGNIIANTSITIDGGSAMSSLVALTGAVTISAATAISVVSEQVSTSTLNISIPINEPVLKIVNAFIKIDASNTIYNFDQATVSINDSQNALSGFNESGMPVSDRKIIELIGFPESAFNPNDLIAVKYVTQDHL
jgi:hypothetical protein